MIPRKTRIKNFIIHTLIKIFIFAVALGMIGFVINFPGLANELAMGQLDHDNISYVFWSIYVVVKGAFNSLYDLIICFFAGTIIYDIITFIKYIKGVK